MREHMLYKPLPPLWELHNFLFIKKRHSLTCSPLMNNFLFRQTLFINTITKKSRKKGAPWVITTSMKDLLKNNELYIISNIWSFK